MDVVTFADRPELATQGIPDELVWPEYNLHGEVTGRLWSRLHADFPQFQFGLYSNGDLLAEGHAVPCWWNGTEEGLSSGVDETLQTACDTFDRNGPVNTLCAMTATVDPAARGQGLSSRLLEAMGDLAERARLEHLIAPVRPSLKDRYPITPIERYATWRREDGRHFDPWIRVHESLGARLGRALPRSLRIAGRVADWAAWTGMAFPESGEYVFPDGLAPVTIDRDEDLGVYWEPNVWLIHR